MVKAGASIDHVINELLPYLEDGDVVVDGGNSLFTDTNRRSLNLKERGIRFLGMGVSGGEEGALPGPSMMPGGDALAYARIERELGFLWSRRPQLLPIRSGWKTFGTAHN